MPKRKANGMTKGATRQGSAGRAAAKPTSAKPTSAKPTSAKPTSAKPTSARAAKSNGNGAGAKQAARGTKKPAGRKKAAPVPPQYGTATPHLIVSPCQDALEFYTKAFGAKVLLTMPGPEGRILHAEMKIGDSIVMCSDEMQMPGDSSASAGPSRKTPKNAGATTGGVMLYLKDVDAFFERAVAAGATPVMPPADQFWGDRYGQIEDPYGHVWALATHLRDMTPREMKKALEQMGAAQA